MQVDGSRDVRAYSVVACWVCAGGTGVAHAYVKSVRQAVFRGVRRARSGRVDVRAMYGSSLGLYVALLTQDSGISASPWWWSSLTQAGGKSDV